MRSKQILTDILIGTTLAYGGACTIDVELPEITTSAGDTGRPIGSTGMEDSTSSSSDDGLDDTMGSSSGGEIEWPYVACRADGTIMRGEGECTIREASQGHNSFENERINLIAVGTNFNSLPEFEDWTYLLFHDTATNPDAVFNDSLLSEYSDKFNVWVAQELATVESYEEGWEFSGSEAVEPSLEIINDTGAWALPNRSYAFMPNWYFRAHAFEGPELGRVNTNELDLTNIQTILANYNIPGDIFGKNECDNFVTEMGCDATHEDNPFGQDFCDAIEELGGTQPTELNVTLCALFSGGSNGYYTASIEGGMEYFEASSRTHLHEMGHTIFGFHDEYGEGGTPGEETLANLEMNPRNCYIATSELGTPADLQADCEANAPWAGLINYSFNSMDLPGPPEGYVESEIVTCRPGCRYMDYFDDESGTARGAFQAGWAGRMDDSDPWGSNYWGEVQERRICAMLAMQTDIDVFDSGRCAEIGYQH